MANDYISQVTLPDNLTYDIRDEGAVRGNSRVFYGTCDTTAGTAIKEVTCPIFTSNDLTAGTIVNVLFTVTNSAAVGDIKLRINSIGNGAAIKYTYNGSYSTIPDKGWLKLNQIYQFIYDGTNWIVGMMRNTNDDTFARYIGHYNNIKARKAITAESLIVGDSTGYEKVASGVTFDISYAIVWCTAAVAKDSSNYANMFLQHYDRNIATGAKSGFTSAANKVIYLIVTINGNIATIDDNIITDTLPSTEDDKVYIVLGKLGAQSTGANYFFFYPAHPMFWYKDGAIREYSGASEYALTAPLSGISGADDLKAIEALSGTSGFLKKTAANTWTLDTNTYLTSHQTYTAFTGKPTDNQTPGFGSTFTIQQISQNTSGQVSGTDRTVTIPSTAASATTAGLVNTDAQTFAGVKTFDNGIHIYGTISTQGTGSVAGTMYPGGAYHSGHNSLILHGDTAGVSGIGFTSEKATKSGTTTNINSSSDRAFIQYHAYGVTPAAEGTAPTLATSGEAGVLVLGVGNDATDTIRLQAPGTAGILHQIGATAYPIPHTTNTNGSVGGTTTPVYVDAGVIKALSYTIAKSVPSDAVFTDTTSFTITANATDGLWDLIGTSGTNAVTYALAPYSSKSTTATFYTAATNPTLTTRLNYDGYLYATKLYSGGTEVSVSGHTHSYAGSSSAGGAATNVTTTADTTNSLYLVGVVNGATTTLKYDTSVAVKGGEMSATTYKVDSHVTLQYNSTDSALEFVFA